MSSILLRQLLLSLALLLPFETQPIALAQGKIFFRNHVLWTTPDPIIAPVSFAPTGALLSTGFYAQLYATTAGASLSTLIPDGPILAFSSVVPGYIIPGAEISLDNFRIGQPVTVVIRAFNGVNWETSSIRGESNPLSLTLGSIDGTPLFGLEPFTVDYIPEPGTVSIFCIGTAA